MMQGLEVLVEQGTAVDQSQHRDAPETDLCARVVQLAVVK